MLLLNNTVPHHNSIKNIIFDFGGVICNIDLSRSEEKFRQFGPVKTLNSNSSEEINFQFENLVEQLETGNITPDGFRETIRGNYLTTPSDESIDDAWNAMILDIPDYRIRLLEQLREQYNIFLLSNSNQIHHTKYLKDFQRDFGYHDFNDLFRKAWFSFRVRMKKPDREIFEFALCDAGILAHETLFIDDTLINTEGARSIGITGFHLEKGSEFGDLFSNQT
jgi:glucose-1-phosphatase